MLSRTAVIMPVHNGAAFLHESLGAVQRQTLAPLELVAVDDGSTDDSRAILEHHGVRVVAQPNAGVTRARNRGRRELLTQPDFLLFVDQDDTIEPMLLERLQAELERSGAVAVHCGVRVMDEDGRDVDEGGWPPRRAPTVRGRARRMQPTEPVTPLLSIIDFAAIIPSNLLISAEVFDRVGGWDEAYRRGGAEDTALAVELALHGDVRFVPEVLARHRRHVGQESADHDAVRVAQRALIDKLRSRREPALRAAIRAHDLQIALPRSLRAARLAAREGHLLRAAHIAGGAARQVAQDWSVGAVLRTRR